MDSALPENIKEVIHNFDGSDGAFVDRLSLTSDGHIQMPGKRLDADILHPEEKETLNAKHKMVVRFFGRGPEPEEVYLQMLNLVKYDNGTYSFEHGWDKVVKRSKLKNGDTIDLWSFVEKIDEENKKKNGPSFHRYFIMAKVNQGTAKKRLTTVIAYISIFIIVFGMVVFRSGL